MKTKSKFIIFLTCYLAYTAIYVARLNLTMATPGFKAENILSQEQIGLMGSAFFVVYALGRIINGYIGDKTSPWIMISTGLILLGHIQPLSFSERFFLGMLAKKMIKD